MEKSPSWEANRFQIVKKIPAFYGTQRFITEFTSVRHLSLSWVSLIQFISPNPTSWRSIWILSSHLRLDLPSGLFPSGFPTKTLYTLLFSTIRATCPVHIILLYLITRNILGEVYRSLSSSLCNFLHYPVTLPLLGQNILLNTLCKNTLSLRSSPQRKRPSFTPIQNKRHKYIHTRIYIYICNTIQLGNTGIKGKTENTHWYRRCKIKFQLASLLHWIRMSPTLFSEIPYCFLFGISHHVFWWGITIYGGNEKQCWISSHERRLDDSHCFSEGLWFIIPILCWTQSILWDLFKTHESSFHVTACHYTDRFY